MPPAIEITFERISIAPYRRPVIGRQVNVGGESEVLAVVVFSTIHLLRQIGQFGPVGYQVGVIGRGELYGYQVIGGYGRGLGGEAFTGRPVRVIRAIACLHLQLRQVRVIACIPTITPSQYRTKVTKIDTWIAIHVVPGSIVDNAAVHLYLGGGVVGVESGLTPLFPNYPVTE